MLAAPHSVDDDGPNMPEPPSRRKAEGPYHRAHPLALGSMLRVDELPVYAPGGGEAECLVTVPAHGGVLDVAVDEECGKVWSLNHGEQLTRLEEVWQGRSSLWVLPGQFHARSVLFKRGGVVTLLVMEHHAAEELGALAELRFREGEGFPEMETRFLRSYPDGHLEYDRHLIGQRGLAQLKLLDKLGAVVRALDQEHDNTLDLPLAARKLMDRPVAFSPDSRRVAWVDYGDEVHLARRLPDGWRETKCSLEGGAEGWPVKEVIATSVALTTTGLAVGLSIREAQPDSLPRVVWLRQEGEKLTVERVVKGLLARPMQRW